MKAEEIARYLQDHPEFFERYGELLTRLTLPNPYGDAAISIPERQTAALREKVKQLEAKLAELIRYGEENDAIAAKVHQLGVALLGAADRPAVLHALYAHLGGSFAVPHVALRVWGASSPQREVSPPTPQPPPQGGGGVDVPEVAPVSDDARAFAETLAHPYCGPGAGPDVIAWFGEAGVHVRSLAFLALRDSTDTFGLMVMGSEESQRFYPGMGTLYLEQIGDMASAALVRTQM